MEAATTFMIRTICFNKNYEDGWVSHKCDA